MLGYLLVQLKMRCGSDTGKIRKIGCGGPFFLHQVFNRNHLCQRVDEVVALSLHFEAFKAFSQLMSFAKNFLFVDGEEGIGRQLLQVDGRGPVIVFFEGAQQMRIGAAAGCRVGHIAFEGSEHIGRKNIGVEEGLHKRLELVFPLRSVGLYRVFVLHPIGHVCNFVHQGYHEGVFVQVVVHRNAVRLALDWRTVIAQLGGARARNFKCGLVVVDAIEQRLGYRGGHVLGEGCYVFCRSQGGF